MHNILAYGISFVVASVLLSGCISGKPAQLSLSPEITHTAEASQLITVGTPVGPSKGYVDEKLTYSADVKSALSGEQIYGFDWGDGSYTWESSAIASHSWSESGIYIVRVQARCNEAISEWSHAKVVMIGSAIVSRSPQPEQSMRYVTPDVAEIQEAAKAILSSKSKKYYSDFDAIREWVATSIYYKSDEENFGVTDYWQFPVETMERGSGECKDFATLLCSLLRASGVPADQVYVAVGTPKGMNEYHAYLIERYSKGVWNLIEPQLDTVTSAVSFTFLDWALVSDYSSDLYCFNDKYFFRGPPAALSQSIYEFNLWHSLWPFLPCSSVSLERQLVKGDRVEGIVEWLGADRIIIDWSLNIYNPGGDMVLTWSGNDMKHDFVLQAVNSGIYRLEIIKRDYSPRNVRLILNPPGWKKSGD